MNSDCILDQIEANMSHNTCVSHMTDINLGDLHLTIFILFQIK